MMTLVLIKNEIDLAEINQIFTEIAIDVKDFKMEMNECDKDKVMYTFKIKAPNTIKYLDIIKPLQNLSYVSSVQFSNQS